MKIASATQMAAIEKETITTWGVSGALLMENAGRAVAYELAKRWPAPRCVTVLCGPGNNGGDGYCAARTLRNLGYQVRCFSETMPDAYSEEAAAQRHAWELAGGVVEDWDAWFVALSSCDVVIDALFGTGLHRPLANKYAQIIVTLNESELPVVAIDIPSGVSCDTGAILGCAPYCALTVTMGLPKPGLMLYPGRELAGERIVVEVGFARTLLEDLSLKGEINSTENVKRLWLRPRPDAHKGSQGCALIVGGSTWYYGAPLLACAGALRTGAGICMWAAPEELVRTRPFNQREVIVWPLPTDQGYLGTAAAWELQGGLASGRGSVSGRSWPKVKAVCLGPGLGRSEHSEQLVAGLLENVALPCVIDADALYMLRDCELPPGAVLTPHHGEMAALLGCSVEEVENDLISAAFRAAEQYRAVIVLKGAPTIICADGRYWLNDMSVPVLAQGGTGDVLAGVITSLLAQGYSPREAAVVGVYLHGRAGMLAAQEYGPQGVAAGEIADYIPKVYKEFLCDDICFDDEITWAPSHCF